MNQNLARFAVLSLITLSLIFNESAPASSALNMPKNRIVVKKSWPMEPVKIVGVKTKNKGTVELGRAFEEEDDWLEGLVLTVVNKYAKTVTAMTISLIFRREAGDARPPFAWNLHFGPSPRSAEYNFRDPDKVIKVGKTQELRLTPGNYESLLQGFEEAGYPPGINRLDLEVREVGFEDGSMIYSGTLYLQDPAYPKDPTKKIKPGQRNAPQSRSSPGRRQLMTDVSFLKASATLSNSFEPLNPALQGGCKIQEGPRTSFCPPPPPFNGCSRVTDLLDPFVSGPYEVELRSEFCGFFLNGQWVECNQLAEVDRFVSCGSGTSCAQQYESCLTNNDCCNGLYCSGGQCDSCDPPCTGEYVCVEGLCSNASPIVVDTLGNGFDLTDATSGVSFDLNGNGESNKISWTSYGSDDAWLSLDRNENGVIDNGRELFGDNTPQPASGGRNGFLALGEFDKARNGGNADGRIDANDAVFSSLRLWRDTNHNGISESGELHTLASLRVLGLDLAFKESRKADQFGNQFRYRAKVYGQGNSDVNKWAWDVFLLNAP
jgi:hypothetical protein